MIFGFFSYLLYFFRDTYITIFSLEIKTPKAKRLLTNPFTFGVGKLTGAGIKTILFLVTVTEVLRASNQIIPGVDSRPMKAQFKVEVRPGGIAGITQ